ncbi:MAG: ECF transporter S component [Bacillota bacterium]
MNKNTRATVWASFFIILGIILPRITNFIGSPTLGNLLSPMHISVFLTGLTLGPLFGFIVGAVTPLFSTLLTGMPPFSPPITVLMAFELAGYGLLSGLFYIYFKKNIYLSLILSMIGGRIIFALALAYIAPLFAFDPPFINFMKASIITAVPAVIIQIILLPLIVKKVEPVRRFSQEMKEG